MGPASFLVLMLFFLHIVICVWGYSDALKNGKSNGFALGILFLLLFFPIIGLIIYLLIRKM